MTSAEVRSLELFSSLLAKGSLPTNYGGGRINIALDLYKKIREEAARKAALTRGKKSVLQLIEHMKNKDVGNAKKILRKLKNSKLIGKGAKDKLQALSEALAGSDNDTAIAVAAGINNWINDEGVESDKRKAAYADKAQALEAQHEEAAQEKPESAQQDSPAAVIDGTPKLTTVGGEGQKLAAKAAVQLKAAVNDKKNRPYRLKEAANYLLQLKYKMDSTLKRDILEGLALEARGMAQNVDSVDTEDIRELHSAVRGMVSAVTGDVATQQEPVHEIGKSYAFKVREENGGVRDIIGKAVALKGAPEGFRFIAAFDDGQYKIYEVSCGHRVGYVKGNLKDAIKSAEHAIEVNGVDTLKSKVAQFIQEKGRLNAEPLDPVETPNALLSPSEQKPVISESTGNGELNNKFAGQYEHYQKALTSPDVVKSAPPADSGVNMSMFLGMKNGATGLFKPDRPSAPLAHWRPMFNQKFEASDREALAYQVDSLLGLGVVPPTYIRHAALDAGMVEKYLKKEPVKDRYSGKKYDSFTPPEDLNNARGSIQLAIKGDSIDKKGLEYEPFDSLTDEQKLDMQKIAVFDYIVGQTDRHGGNTWVGDDNKIYAIDNGFSFPRSNESTLSLPFLVFKRHLKESGGGIDPRILKQLSTIKESDFKSLFPEGVRLEGDIAWKKLQVLLTDSEDNPLRNRKV